MRWQAGINCLIGLCAALVLGATLALAQPAGPPQGGGQFYIFKPPGQPSPPGFIPPDPGAMAPNDSRPRFEPGRSAESPAALTLEMQLRLAIGNDDVDGVLDALRRGADVNDPGNMGITPLMTAYSARVAQTLIGAGADVNARAPDGASVLHHAVVVEQASLLVPLLLAHGAKPDVAAAGRDGETPLLTAKLWFFEGRDPAVGVGLMRLLAKHGADVNAADRAGYTLLMAAAVNRKFNLAKLMLELGADPSRRSKEGRTALAYAEELGANDIVRLLRAAGVRG